MNRKIALSALMSMVLVSVVVMVPVLQTSTNAVATATAREEFSSTSEERFLSPAQRLPEPLKSLLTKMASMRSELASKYPSIGPRMVEPQQEWAANITVGRYEFVDFIVDKNFAPVKPSWNVTDWITPPPPAPVYYVADSLYYVSYGIDIVEGTDPGLVTLTDAWKKGMVWGTGTDVAKSYYLLGWDTNIPGAGPGNYTAATGVLSLTFDPEEGPTTYYIDFLFLAKTGFVNQFISKPKVSHTLSPKTTPPLTTGTFYDMWLKMKGFKVRGLPLMTYVEMDVPDWQSTENGVYIKNMDPQTALREWWGADSPDVPGPSTGGGGWLYPGLLAPTMPVIDPRFPDHWIQVAFEKSTVTPGPSEGNFLYWGEVGIEYANKGFGIVTGDTPQLTLSPADWAISVTTGLTYDVISDLVYYFIEPKLTMVLITA